jgi:hypothetical protein
MKTGTKSLLFGVHQIFWHPITVWIAWIYLYRKCPTWKESICIIIHDWGYWGKICMDDEEGETHPELGAKIARKLFGQCYYDFCLYHSRHYAKKIGIEPSKLCWADKCSIIFDPWWLYLPRALASGELKEYRKNASNFVPLEKSHKEWFGWIRIRFKNLALEKKNLKK